MEEESTLLILDERREVWSSPLDSIMTNTNLMKQQKAGKKDGKTSWLKQNYVNPQNRPPPRIIRKRVSRAAKGIKTNTRWPSQEKQATQK